MTDMAFAWRRHHHPHPNPNRVAEPERSVADVVHQLQDLTTALRTQVDRLEQVNDSAAQAHEEQR